MRLLVVTPPQLGHVRPLLPLARALAAAGHRVAWASGPDALSHLAREPVEPLPCGGTAATSRDQTFSRWPELALLGPRQHGPAMRRHLFGETIADAMLRALERWVDEWQPDVVLHGPLAIAARPVCRARHLPCVEHAIGWPAPQRADPGTPSAVLEALAEPASPQALRIEIVPATLRTGDMPAGDPVIECRPVDRRLRDVACLPEAVRSLLDRARDGPLVLASFGTVFNSRSALRETAHVLTTMPVRSIVLGVDRASLGVAANARQLCLPWLEQSAILPFCDAVVTHGGAGTVLGALAHGCPLVVLPQGADHFRNADAVRLVAAGLVLEGPFERLHLEAAIREVLDGSGRAGADVAARAIGAMSSPATAADRLIAALEIRASTQDSIRRSSVGKGTVSPPCAVLACGNVRPEAA
jgi:UDP:flavonoid glycosyltransferase YjiC (YdhE family)